MNIELKTGQKTPRTLPKVSARVLGEEANLIMANRLAHHPFESGVHEGNVREILADYLAMAQACPLLRASSQKEWVFHCIQNNREITWEREGTGAVVALTGEGQNRLHRPLAQWPGGTVVPRYSPVTQSYLFELYHGWAHLDAVVRLAAIVAFEAHAEKMVAALAESLRRLPLQVSPPPPEPNPFPAPTASEGSWGVKAEGNIPLRRVKDFFLAFEKGYRLSYDWCGNLVR